MTLTFKQLADFIPDSTVHTFINFIKLEHKTTDEDFFIFDQDVINRRFLSSLQAMDSDLTIDPDFFTDDIHVVAMTIDGDFILASDTEIYVMEKGLIADDVEVYDLSAIEFFVAFEQGFLASDILPDIKQN